MKRTLLALALVVGCGDAGGSPYGEPLACDEVFGEALGPDTGGFYVGYVGSFVPHAPGEVLTVTGCDPWRIVDGVDEAPLVEVGEDGCTMITTIETPADDVGMGATGVPCEGKSRLEAEVGAGLTTVEDGFSEVYIAWRPL